MVVALAFGEVFSSAIVRLVVPAAYAGAGTPSSRDGGTKGRSCFGLTA
jgi:hypothetical protein